MKLREFLNTVDDDTLVCVLSSSSNDSVWSFDYDFEYQLETMCPGHDGVEYNFLEKEVRSVKLNFDSNPYDKEAYLEVTVKF